MRLSISNIAWDVEKDKAIVELLHRYGIDAIDVAPGKYFPEPTQATAEDIANVKSWWSGQGIDIIGMQALLFGTSGLNIFGTTEVQEKMIAHLSAVCRIAAGLGAKKLVFGSPRNRDCTGLNEQETIDIAVSFFKRLGEVANEYGVVICLEPNPTCYGANFMTTNAETVNIVRRVGHSAIKMQLDTGALTINHETSSVVLENYADLIGHIHLSEPDLLPLGDADTDHKQINKSIQQHLSEHIATIEMLATAKESHLVSVERALNYAVKFYRKGFDA